MWYFQKILTVNSFLPAKNQLLNFQFDTINYLHAKFQINNLRNNFGLQKKNSKKEKNELKSVFTNTKKITNLFDTHQLEV